MPNAFLYRLRSVVTVTALLLLIPVLPVLAQEQPAAPTLEFRPHCEETEPDRCLSFTVADPTAVQTPVLTVGDTLDIDVILRNPAGTPINTVRSWLSYDTSVLEGVSVTLGSGFVVRIPSEGEIDQASGYIKIGVAAEDDKEPLVPIVPIARVQFRVKTAPAAGKSPVVFYDQKEDGKGRTAVIAAGDDTRKSMITLPLGSLLVRVSAPAAPAASSSAAVSSAAVSAAQSSVAAGSPSSATGSSARSSPAPSGILPFRLLQVQNVRITSDDGTLFVAWDQLKIPRLKGYNVYYGSQMGRYIQRRSLPATSQSIAIRGLQKGTAYYAAVRAVNESDEESAFSREVGVEIGKPNTSTSPLLTIPVEGGLTGNVTGGNPLSPSKPGTAVPGEAGASTVLLMLAAASAVIGVFVALRRQFIAVGHSSPRS